MAALWLNKFQNPYIALVPACALKSLTQEFYDKKHEPDGVSQSQKLLKDKPDIVIQYLEGASHCCMNSVSIQIPSSL